MTWAERLTRDELIEHIETFRDHPDFLKARQSHLKRAVYEKDLELVQLLLEAGAGPDCLEPWGESLLHHLVHEYQATRTTKGQLVLQLAELLLTHGANPEQVGAGNWRAMDHCIEDGVTEMMNLLIRYGANPKQREYV